MSVRSLQHIALAVLDVPLGQTFYTDFGTNFEGTD